jgi:glycosyltransferase involved in cell wall biosynthesis
MAADLQMTTKITIALCCFNSSRTLSETLQNLHSISEIDFLILVVDDGSVDNTRQIAESFGVRVIRHERNLGYGAARKSALDNCQTDLIAFIDDSCLVDRLWLERLVADWQNAASNVKAIAGPMEIESHSKLLKNFLNRNNPFRPIRNRSKSLRLLSRLQNYFFEKRNLESGYVSFAPNGNLSMNVESARSAGGYDATLWFSGEDDDICQKIIAHYGPNSILFHSDLVVRHRVKNVYEVFHRNYRYGNECGYLWRRNFGIPTFEIRVPLVAVLCFFFISITGVIPGTLLSISLMVFLYSFKNPITKYLLIDSVIEFALMSFHTWGFLYAAIKSPKLAKNV